ncbi:hypothetical protein [Cochlodiniinecator piscidefendens]|uniref:hypothetical protein n=1 Tax=Cochlodiniinecator piscidefendens TaxID=2715756 RepID=UPI0014099010|nr:hypothetical protein [Cochlodiniinecator piscidefendens]
MGADAFQGSLIAYREISDRNNWYFWIALFYVCQLLALCGAAMAWDHISSPAELFLVCEIGGMIIGYILMMMVVESENKLPIQRYNLDRYLTKSVVGSILYFSWPVVVFILIAGGIFFLPTQDQNTVHIFIAVVLGVMFMPLYHYANLAAMIPRLLGYVMLVSGVLWY